MDAGVAVGAVWGIEVALEAFEGPGDEEGVTKGGPFGDMIKFATCWTPSWNLAMWFFKVVVLLSFLPQLSQGSSGLAAAAWVLDWSPSVILLKI